MTEPENIKSPPADDQQGTEFNLSAPGPGEVETEKNSRAPGAKKRVTEKNISAPELKAESKRGRPARETPEAAKWSLRGVEPETRTALNKAADKLGKTVGEFFNSDLRNYATEILKGQPSSPPAAPQDIEQMIEAKMTVMGQSIIDKLSAQLDQMKPVEEPKKGLLARILGK
ncbi:MAG: hypothetical protein EOO61_01350 [Hymenobacter sp.]|nr:MAG: hypothetical protein EOO61_01350 [Hymenobacter sp.]